MILITGTGRSGTLSIVNQLQDAGLDAVHEPMSPGTLVPAVFWSSGAMSMRGARMWLSRIDWPEDAAAHWLYATLLEPLDILFPDARWVWAVRNAEDTVASMCHKGWWLPSDDEGWPVLTTWPGGERCEEVFSSPPWRCRPNGYSLGAMEYGEWRALPQVGRAAWWWGWVYQTMRRWPAVRYPIELQDPQQLFDALGVDYQVEKHWLSNPSRKQPALPDGAVSWLDRFCAEGMADLYRGWDGSGRRP